MRSVRRRWEEGRGDAYDGSGPSWWLFEIDRVGRVLRQVVACEAGPRLRYDREHSGGVFDALAEAPVSDAEADRWATTPDAFEAAWVGARYDAPVLPIPGQPRREGPFP